MIAFSLTSVCMLLLYLLRMNLTHKYRMARIEEIDIAATRLIEQDQPWKHLYHELFSLPHRSMLLDLTRWRYRSFFPEIKG